MKRKIVYFVPIFLLIVSIITSFVAFSYSEKLENGYIYISDMPSTVAFEGEYFAIMGNLGDSSSYVTVDSLNQHLLITVYDSNELIIKEYSLEIKKEGTTYSQDIIISYIGTNLINIEEIDEYIFTLDLEKDETYETIFTETSNNVDNEELDLVLVNIPEYLLNMKSLNEGVSFTTLIFAVISGFTILVILFVKKDN